MGKLLNIIPVSDLRQDASKILKQLKDNVVWIVAV
jgi:hypothetical protein